MFPYIDLHFIKLPCYGLCIVTGVLISFIWAVISVRKRANIWDFIICSAVSFGLSFLCAKLLFVAVTYPPSEYGKLLLLLLKGKVSTGGGFVFYGGLAGGIAGFFLGALIAKCSPFQYLDYGAVVLPFVQCFGRLGCFCAGCCYGIPYNGPFAVTFTAPLSTAPVNTPLFPVQLLEAVLMLSLSIVLLVLFYKNKKHLIVIYLFAYSVIRFCLEYLRYDSERGSIFCFSTSQFISLLMFAGAAAATILIKVNENRRKKAALL